MKIININESQKKRLFEAYDGNFSFDELDKQGDLSSMYNYCINISCWRSVFYIQKEKGKLIY